MNTINRFNFNTSQTSIIILYSVLQLIYCYIIGYFIQHMVIILLPYYWLFCPVYGWLSIYCKA